MEKVILRNYRMDNIKCLMILGIVLEHSLMIYGYPRWIELFWAIFISWLMPLFTLISGFFSKEYEFKTLLKKYLYPMFLFSAVNFLVGYAFNPAYKTGVHLIGYAMWYLWALFFFVYLTPKIQRKVRLKKLLIASLLLALLFPILPDVGIGKWLNILSFNRLVGFFPFFLVGCLLKRHYTAFCKKLTALWGGILLIISMLIYIGICWKIETIVWKSGFYLMLGGGVRFSLEIFVSYIFITLISLSVVSVVPNCKSIFSIGGQRTINVYFLHMLVVFPLCYGLFSKLGNNFFLVGINGVLSIMLCRNYSVKAVLCA